VYIADTFSEVSVITVDGLEFPTDIVACRDDHYLYVIGGLWSIWRVSAVNPTDYENWLTVEEALLNLHTLWLFSSPYTLSLKSRRLLVTSQYSHSLHLYNTVNKELLRVIDLPDSVKDPTHAVETSRDTFVVSHSGPPSGVSELFSFLVCLLIFTPRVLRS